VKAFSAEPRYRDVGLRETGVDEQRIVGATRKADEDITVCDFDLPSV
jgi:hypothetical protein